jgi:hypothetical protein
MYDCFGYLRRDTMLILMITAQAINCVATEISIGSDFICNSCEFLNTKKLNE